VLWEFGTYTKELYIHLREKEFEYWRVKGSVVDSPLIPEEIAITKIYLDPENKEMLDYYRDGVIDNNRVRNRFNIEVIGK
jgi:hypothetical protein